MKRRRLLLVMNPRRIEPCIESIAALDTPKVWMQGFTEFELQTVIADIIETSDYDSYAVLADDCIVSQGAWDAVCGLHDEGHDAATGYCNLDASSPLVTVQLTPLEHREPRGKESYKFITTDEMASQPRVVRTYFAGMCMTSLTRELWKKYPFGVYGEPGAASDYHLCRRLQLDDVPIVTTAAAKVIHEKEDWTKVDHRPHKRLFLGEGHRRVVWDV